MQGNTRPLHMYCFSHSGQAFWGGINIIRICESPLGEEKATRSQIMLLFIQ